MQYNSNSNNEDCVSEVLDICGATTNTYSLNKLTRRFNRALDDYFDIAFEADGTWPFDDFNQSSAAIVTQSLVSGTKTYKISSFDGSAIGIFGISILKDDGTVKKLEPENFTEIEVEFESLYDTSNTGEPTHYAKFGDFLYLRPTPNYNETNGLRAYTERDPLYMASNDTTKEPGVPKKHHMWLCRKTALPYLIEKRLPQTQAIAQLVAEGEIDIMRYFSRREKDVVHRMTALKQDNR